MTTDPEAVDFVISAWREAGSWNVEQLPAKAAGNLASLVASLGAHNAEYGALGMVSVGDDFFLLLRVRDGRVRLILSDVAAALDWPLALEALQLLGVPAPDDVDDVEFEPAGDLTILTDLGMAAEELGLLCEDPDLYPDEVLGVVAERIGMGRQFDEIAGREV